MRKVKKVKRALQLAADQPLPIIRFDIQAYNDYLLRPPTNRAIQFCKKTIQNHMALLKLSAAQANTVCLASNQLMLDSSLITMHKRIQKSQSQQGGMNWIDAKYNSSQDYHTYHLPEVISGRQLIQHVEESISYPFLLFKVKRYNQISISFKDQFHQTQYRQLKNFEAWAFQQSQQQMKGQSLLDWRINHGKIEFNAQAAQHFPKTLSILEEYIQDLSKTFKEYPQLLEKVEQFRHPFQRKNSFQDEPLPYQTDFYRRLTKHYEKQMSYLQQKLSEGSKLNGQHQQWKEPKKIDVTIIDK